MRRRRQKWIIATAIVALTYVVCVAAIGGDVETSTRVSTLLNTRLPGELLLALMPAAAVALFLVIDTYLPIGSRVIDDIHRGLRLARYHLISRAHHNDYWFLRLGVGVGVLVIVQIVTDITDHFRVG